MAGIAPAVKKLSTLEGNAYQRARYEIAEAMNYADKTGATKKAGDLFLEFTSASRFAPAGTAGEQAAKGALQTSGNPAVRAAVDVGAATEKERDVPAGPAGIAAGGTGLGHLARRIIWGHY